MAQSFFIADLHLSPRAPERGRRFMCFLDALPDGSALYILGDLFDYFAGSRHWDAPDYREVIAALERLSRRGNRLFFLAGNRDFQATALFQRRLGAEVARDSLVKNFGPRRAYLTHGDLLCTADFKYLRFRRWVRHPAIAAMAERVPPGLTRAVGARLRSYSHRVVREKPAEMLRITAQGLLGALQSGAQVVVCGHVHRLQHLSGMVGGMHRELFVLGDWDTAGSYVHHDGGDRWSLRLLDHAGAGVFDCNAPRAP